MYCIKCGAEMAEGTSFCTSCGAKQKNQPVVTPPVAQPAVFETNAGQVQPPIQNPMNDNRNNSFFDGGLWGMIGVNLVVSFLTMITFGLAGPALWCYRLRWVYKHTVVGGYRLKFTGKGGQLFGKMLLWSLLSLVTFTIYSWWVPIKYKKWETSHVVIDSMIL